MAPNIGLKEEMGGEDLRVIGMGDGNVEVFCIDLLIFILMKGALELGVFFYWCIGL